tara:strand:+ start:176 stop:475 length:300 start_codon:yes stop_codon:yes gene_type:complete
MDKKERYYNFIVADLVKKTEIDYDQEIIKLPFLHPPHSPSTLYSPFPSPLSNNLLHSFFKSFSTSFSNHVRKVYGAHSEEINIIWNLYKDRLHSLINNE